MTKEPLMEDEFKLSDQTIKELKQVIERSERELTEKEKEDLEPKSLEDLKKQVNVKMDMKSVGEKRNDERVNLKAKDKDDKQKK